MTFPRPVFIIALATAFSLLGDSTLYVVLPADADRLGIPLAFVGVLLSINRFVRFFTNSVAGYVLDYAPRWWHFVLALVIGACTTAAYGLFWTYLSLFLIARIVWGTCWSFLRLEGYATVMQYATTRNRGTLMGVYKSISGIGFLGGSLFGGVLTDMIGFRRCLLTFAGLTFLGAVATFFELLRSHKAKSLEKQPPHPSAETHRPSTPARFPLQRWFSDSLPMLVKDWPIYYTGFINVLVSGSVISSTLGLQLRTHLKNGARFFGVHIRIASLTGILLAFQWCISFFGSPVFGHLADRFGRKRVLCTGFSSAIFAFIVLLMKPTLFGMSTAVIFAAMSRTAVSVTLDAAIADAAKAGQRGRMIGVYTTVNDLGSATGPLVSYIVSARVGALLGLNWVYTLGLGLLVSSLIVSLVRTWTGDD